jgi:hypothetical protein
LRAALLAALLMTSAGAAAQEAARPLCPSRPGLGTTPCIVDAGHLLGEVALADWTLDRAEGERSDTILLGDTLVRLGVAERLELQLGLTAVGIARERDAGGRIDRRTRPGDLTAGAKLNLLNPDGSGLSVSIQANATLPVGRDPIGDGTWSAGGLLAINYDLSETLHLGLTPEVDAAADEDRQGRHLAFGSVVGLTADLTDRLAGSVELLALQDRDPAGHGTVTLAGTSLAWQPGENLQLDAGANLGLNRASADLELYVGVSRRF